MSTGKSLFISFNRRLDRYLGLAFGTAFLNLITFGLYKPYGLTRIRRALYNNITVGGDALDYSGTAQGLSAVTFYPSLAFLFLMLGPGILQFLVPLWWAVAIGVVQLLLIIAFFHYREFLWRQYELSNLSWRGQSFNLLGSAWRSMCVVLGFQLFNLLTVGLAVPWQRVWKARRDYDGLYYGRQQVSCSMSVRPVLGLYVLGWVGSLAGFIVMLLWLWDDAWQAAWQVYNGALADPSAAEMVGNAFSNSMAGAPDEQTLAVFGTYMWAAIAPFMAWPLWVSWRLLCLAPFEAEWWRQLAASLSLHNYRPAFEGGTLALFVINVISFNCNFITANLTRPFTTYARLRYFCSRLMVRETIT